MKYLSSKWFVNSALLLLLNHQSTKAQAIPDTSLPSNSTVIKQDNINLIEGGTKAGSNLFHSFQDFSVPTGEIADFNNALDIQNIISRVTGKSISNIDGLIKASGTANLFLINPNGIIFGQNAFLDIGGSFLASTANSLKFADGTEFSANVPKTTPLLTISAPIGLQFGANQGKIEVRGDGKGTRLTTELIDITDTLRVQSDQTLALLGGDISLEGATIKTSGGRVELGSVKSEDFVSLISVDKGFSLDYGGVQKFGEIQLSQQSAVDASGEGGGDVQLVGRRVVITGASQIEASTLRSKPGGSLVIKAPESVEIFGTSPDGFFGSGLATLVYPGATGNGGDLTINTNVLLVGNGAQIATATFGQGKGGNLLVNASQKAQLIGTSTNARSASGLVTASQASATGAAGNLTVNTSTLLIQDGAQIATGTFGQGQGGNLTVNASQVVHLTGASATFPTTLTTTAQPGSAGAAGNLIINTDILLIQNGAGVAASTFGQGRGGDLKVNALQKVELTGSSANFPSTLATQANRGSTGLAGDLTIKTSALQIDDKALVAVSSQEKGNAGNLNINAAFISLNNQAKISGTASSGNGGNIFLEVQNLLLLRRNSQISATAGTARAGGDGGNITINTPNGFIVAVSSENSDITANAFTGSGGRININAYSIFGTRPRSRDDLVRLLETSDANQLDPQKLQTSEITAISQANPNLSGELNINTPDVEPSQGLIELPVELSEARIAQGCPALAGENSSYFTITGRSGLPLLPNELLRSDRPISVGWVSLRDMKRLLEDLSSNSSIPNPIVEATNWTVNKKGEVILTAAIPINAWNKFLLASARCLS